MKDKPTKWGIKVFVLADSQTGYVKRLQVYTGKGLDSCVSDVGLCTRVVLLHTGRYKCFYTEFFIGNSA